MRRVKGACIGCAFAQFVRDVLTSGGVSHAAAVRSAHQQCVVLCVVAAPSVAACCGVVRAVLMNYFCVVRFTQYAHFSVVRLTLCIYSGLLRPL